MEPIVVTRTLPLAASASAVWRSLSSADALATWLGERVSLDGAGRIEPGATGLVHDDGRARRLVVTEVHEGRALHLTWWDDEAPSDASTVAIELDECGGETTVTVTERLLGGAVASVAQASAIDLHDDVLASWDRRLRALVGDLVLAPATA